MSDELTPITRKETFLAKAGGQNVVTPTPITREETFLQAIIDNGSGGGGGGGVLMVGISGDETLTMDKTFGEIKSTILTTAVVFQYVVNDGGVLSVIPFTVIELTDSPDGKVISMLGDGEQYRFIAGTDADYPTT